jgi:chromosome segregation ATPase
VRTELAAISTARDATEHLRDVVRASIAEGDNKQVAEARKQLEKAQQAYDKILQQDKFAEAAKAVEEAHQNYDKQHKKLFEGLDEYSKLSAQQDKLQQQLDALNKQTLKVKSADEVQKLASQAGELQQQIEDLYWQKREIRISVGKDLWDDVWHARGRKQDALNDLVDADPKASAARAKVKQAERELAAAVDQAVQEDQSARTIRAVLQDLDDKRSALRYQEDLLEHQLEGRGAPIREQVERDPAVASLRQAWQIQERQIRNNPTEAEQKAEQQYESLRAEADALRRELRDNEKLEQARQAEREARDAMRQAEREDKTRDAEKEARQSYEQKLEEVRRELPEAKELVATGRQLSEQREAVRNRIKNLRNELKDAREKIAEAGTGRIAEAREAVSAARLEVQEAERADELQVLRVRADVARKEVRDQAGFVLGLGAGMAESDARIRQIDKELREIKRQLR